MHCDTPYCAMTVAHQIWFEKKTEKMSILVTVVSMRNA